MIFEGANTERKYFQGIDNNRKELGINSQIELVILHKEGEISSFSPPIKLLEIIEEKKKSVSQLHLKSFKEKKYFKLLLT